MFERFESVNKIGLFEAYSHSPEREFGEVTLIYGENGVGKSTLAAILDSLRERNATEITRRKSLPGNVVPTVAVSIGGKVYSFDGHDWNEQLPYETLEVFCPGFVTRNVHAATEVGPNHRRNLCEFVLGRKAVEKVTRLAEADAESREALAEIGEVTKELQLLIKEPDTLETFIGLSNDPIIDERIDNARLELKQAINKDAIHSRPVATAIPLPSVDGAAIIAMLGLSIDGVSTNVANLVQEHISKYLDKDGERWLADGAKCEITDNSCPYCGQDTSASKIVSALKSYFSTEYREFTESLSVQISQVRNRIGTAAFQLIRSALSNQIAVAAQWSDEMPIDHVAIAANLSEAEAIWKVAATKLGAVVAAKQARPLERVDKATIEDALTEYEASIGMIAKVNDFLSASGQLANQRKAALSKANTGEIETRLRHLENQKTRFETLSKDLLDKRNDLLNRRIQLDAEKKKLKKEIDEHGARVVGKYQSGINHYLDYFGCEIKIESFESKFPSGRASIQYTLKIRGHKIDLGVSAESPCFETVLSEGDKYTLALSFFFARLKDHATLTGRVVVLDDPANSLGSSRRSLILGAIRELRARGAQIVVLTHDERLAAMIWRDKKLNKNMVVLQVQRTNSGSQLRTWDIERETQSEYVEHYLALQGYLDNGGNHKPVSGCIRPYLEQRLRHLFPGPPFETRDTLGQMISKIRDGKPGSRLHPLKIKLQDLESINDAALPSHHATDDVPGMTPLNAAGVRLFAEKALRILG